MTQSVILTSPHEVATYRTLICENLGKSRQHLASLCASEDGFSLFQQLKFKKTVVEPLSGQPEHLLEAINQSQTYLVSLAAVSLLFHLHPGHSFRLNWGNVPGYDIQSDDNSIIAECFVATSYRSNQKLRRDLLRLSQNTTAAFRYECFCDRTFTDKSRIYYEKLFPMVKILPLSL